MCLTSRISVFTSAGTGAAASLGCTLNVNAPPFVPSQQSSGSGANAAAQLPAGQKWNIHAPEFIPTHHVSKAGAAAQPGQRWNIHAPKFIPSGQPALSQISQVRLQALTMGSACMHCMHQMFLPGCTCRKSRCARYTVIAPMA